MRKLLFLLAFTSYLAFGQNNILIKETPIAQNQNKPPTNIPTKNQSCPNKDDVKYYLVSHNLAMYTILGIIPSKSVPGYCDVILEGDNKQNFFIRIRNDLAYVISGSVVNTKTNKVVTPDMSNFKTTSPKQ